MAKKTVKLGLMPPLTGIVGIYGTEIVRAAQIACQEVNKAGGVLGQPLELIIEDDGSLPENAVTAARKLIDVHQCKAIIGNLLSNSRIAVAYRIAEPRKLPLLNFSFYEGSIQSRYFFHFAALPNQQIDQMIPYMQKKFGPRMFFAGNNYEWPHGSIQAAKKVLTKNKGIVVGEKYTSIGVSAKEINQLLDQLEQQNPDVFVPYFAGSDQIQLLTHFSERGLKNKIAVVMGHYDEMIASQLPATMREGFYSSNSYFMTIDNAANHDFLAQLEKLPDVNGVWPKGNGIITNFGEGAYLCVKAFAKATNIAQTLDSEALVETLNNVRIDGPQGHVEMDPKIHHASVNSYLSRCRGDGSFEIIEQFGAIKPILPARYNHQRIKNQAIFEEDIRLQARILENMSEGVLLVSPNDLEVVYANPGAERIFGYDLGEMKNLPIDYLHDSQANEDPQSTKTIIQRLKIKGSWQGEFQTLTKLRQLTYCSVNISTFTHPVFGEVWLWVVRDITEAKQKEIQLRESEEKYRLAMESTQEGFWDWKILSGNVYFSPGWERILGEMQHPYSKENWEAHIHPDDRAKMMTSLHNYLDGKISSWENEHRLCNKDGEYIWVLERGRIVERDRNGKPSRMVGTMIDISERKKVEEELIRYKNHLEERVKEQTDSLYKAKKNEEQTRQMLQLVINTIPIRVFWKDKDSIYLGCNSHFALDAGFQTPEQLIGKSDFDMGWHDQAELYRADDHSVIASAQAKLAYEEPLSKPDGSLCWLQTSKVPLFDSHGNTIGVLGTYEDITDRKESENQLIQAKEEAQRANQAKSEFLANMSHELRTPLHGILSFARFGIKNSHKGELDKLKQYFNWINQSGERLLVLLNDLLDLSKLEAGKIQLDIQTHDLKQLTENCVAEMSASFEEKQLQIQWQGTDTPTLANFDKARIGQVITNLLSNAYKYSLQGQTIFIDFSQYSLLNAEQESVPALLFSIRDQGIGIPEAELVSVFDKFVQSSKTKTKAGGTGLGLPISQEIIHSHQGKIWAEHCDQGGAVFKFAIPI